MTDPARRPTPPAMIDLGAIGGGPASTAPDGPPRYGWRRIVAVRVPFLAVALIFLAGGAAGVSVGAGWGHDRALARQRAVETATVAIVANVSRSETTAAGDLIRAQLTGQVTLINAGPLPVEVQAFRGSGPGITLTGIEGRRQIEAGVATSVEAIAVIDCNPGITSAPIQMEVWVETEDGTTRQTRLPVGLEGTAWEEALASVCSPH